MNKIQHPSNNAVLGAPTGWDQIGLPCGALPITRRTLGGVDCVASYWKPTAQELEELNDGGSVVLHVIGSSMPPVALGTAP